MHPFRAVQWWGEASAVLELPTALSWTLHRGETDPILGWYSARFGQKVPTVTLLGSGRSTPSEPLVTTFLPSA